MWNAWNEAAALLVLLAATSPYAAVITGYGILHITEYSASIGGCVLANGTLADLWISDTAVVAYSSSDSLRLVLANSTGVYIAAYRSDGFLGLGEGGRIITYVSGAVDIAGEASVDTSHACAHPFSAKSNGDELAVACDNVLLYYRLGSSTASLVRVANITAVLGLDNSTVLVRLGNSVGFIDVIRHNLLAIACEPLMWGVGDEGAWVACSGEPTEVFLYRDGSLEHAEVPQPYSVCSSASDPCKVAEDSLYIGKLSFTLFEGHMLHKGVQVSNVSVAMRGSVSSSPVYTRVPGNCLTVSSPSFVATGESIPSRLLVGAVMIMGGLISVLLGYRISKQENISREG